MSGAANDQTEPDIAGELTRLLEALPLRDSDYDPVAIPENGIYFFYEDGENWPIGEDIVPRKRVVRIGSHSGDNNLPARIQAHFQDTRRRSTFRYHLGAAIARCRGEPPELLDIWEDRRGKPLPEIEAEVTKVFREHFSFRCFGLPNVNRQMRLDIEAKLISKFSEATSTPSANWLGRHSPRFKVRDSGLWNVHHVFSARRLSPDEISLIQAAVAAQ